jgi:hypothetical protein
MAYRRLCFDLAMASWLAALVLMLAMVVAPRSVSAQYPSAPPPAAPAAAPAPAAPAAGPTKSAWLLAAERGHAEAEKARREERGEAAAPSPAPKVDASQVVPVHPLLLRDRTAAERARKDLGVFGIKLTYPLALPACPEAHPTFLNPLGDAFFGVQIDAPCIGSGGLMKVTNEEAMQANRRRLRDADVAEVTVLFPKSVCPDWLTQEMASACYVNVVLRGGTVASIYFMTRGTDWQRTVVGTLEKKYGRASSDADSEDSSCQFVGRETVRLKVRTFAMPGVHVSYNPIGGQCPGFNGGDGAGLVEIETEAYREWLKQAQKRHEGSRMQL